MKFLNKIICGDYLDLIKGIPDGYIDFCLTSPPYDQIRDYKKNEWTINLPRLGKEISRILKDGGMCALVIQDQTQGGRKSLTSFKTIVNWVENTNLDLWECLIYKRAGTPGAWWSKRFRVDHEYIPIFIKGKRPKIFNKEHMKIDCNWAGTTAFSKSSNRNTKGELLDCDKFIVNKKKCCGTILDYTKSLALEKLNRKNPLKKEHPATFPDKLVEDLILAFTQEKDVVLDPMCGSGTTCVIANKLNRNYIGFDINKEYCELSKKRLETNG